MSFFTWFHERLDDTIIGYEAHYENRGIVTDGRGSIVRATSESMRQWLEAHAIREASTVVPLTYGSIFNTIASAEGDGIVFVLDDMAIERYRQAFSRDQRYQREIWIEAWESGWGVRTAFDLYRKPISDLRDELGRAIVGFNLRLLNGEFFLNYEGRRAVFGSREECVRFSSELGDHGEPVLLQYPRYLELQTEGVQLALDENANQRLNAIRGWEELCEIVEEDDRRQETERLRTNPSYESSALLNELEERLCALPADAIVEPDPIDYSPAYWRSYGDSLQVSGETVQPI